MLGASPAAGLARGRPADRRPGRAGRRRIRVRHLAGRVRRHRLHRAARPAPTLPVLVYRLLGQPGPLELRRRDGRERDPHGPDRAGDPRHRALPRRIGRQLLMLACSRHVSRVRYGDFTAVDGVDLEVADGEIVCVLGPSGSGKSSLLRAVAGLEPDAHRARVVGRRRPRRASRRTAAASASCSRTTRCSRTATCSATSRFGLRMQRLPRAEIDARGARRRSRSWGSPASSDRRIARAVGRRAAAGGARPRARRRAAAAHARRAARRARPRAARAARRRAARAVRATSGSRSCS